MERARRMITIGDILLAKHILIGLHETDTAQSVTQIAGTFKNDPRVKDWERLHEQLQGHIVCANKENGAAFCLAHARTDAVSTIIMAAGQAVGEPFRLIFIIGLPTAMSSEYLRIMGALTRIFRSEKGETALREAATPADFLERLCELEMGL